MNSLSRAAQINELALSLSWARTLPRRRAGGAPQVGPGRPLSPPPPSTGLSWRAGRAAHMVSIFIERTQARCQQNARQPADLGLERGPLAVQAERASERASERETPMLGYKLDQLILSRRCCLGGMGQLGGGDCAILAQSLVVQTDAKARRAAQPWAEEMMYIGHACADATDCAQAHSNFYISTVSPFRMRAHSIVRLCACAALELALSRSLSLESAGQQFKGNPNEILQAISVQCPPLRPDLSKL